MKSTRIIAILFVVTLIITTSACKDNTFVPEPEDTSTKDTIVVLSTSFGNMYLYMFKGTPKHRHNFLKLVKDGFYDDTEFHRLIEGFVIQGGDPNSKDNDRTNDGIGGPGYTIPAEINVSKYTHVDGAIGAASTAAKGPSSGSQFYFIVNANGRPDLNGNYTVFGQLIKGLDVSKTIAQQPKNAKGLPDARIKMTCKIAVKTHAELVKEFGFTAAE